MFSKNGYILYTKIITVCHRVYKGRGEDARLCKTKHSLMNRCKLWKHKNTPTPEHNRKQYQKKKQKGKTRAPDIINRNINRAARRQARANVEHREQAHQGASANSKRESTSLQRTGENREHKNQRTPRHELT